MTPNEHHDSADKNYLASLLNDAWGWFDVICIGAIALMLFVWWVLP